MDKSIIALMFTELRKNPELLTAYVDDWATWDIDFLRNHTGVGDKFIWVLRDHGTHIFHNDERNAVGAIQAMPETTKLYLVSITGIERDKPYRRFGFVEPVTREHAIWWLRRQAEDKRG